ncbi:FG-GAP repeat domain-containing protein [Streptomyces sp. NPDC002004]
MSKRRTAIRAAAAAAGCALLLAGCSGIGGFGDGGKDGRHTPAGAAAGKAPAPLPVPRGKGSRAADDFNGDGHRDLVLPDLVKSPDDAHGDDLGIGVVYGSAHGLVPAARQLLTPTAYGASTKGQLPSSFDAEASCDLDGDGFTDLVVSTDPPYDGQGQPPVPLQILFGSPKGLAGRAVELRVPAAARFGNDWPDQPVCGDFDGDGEQDLVVHATGGRLSYLRGPFGRTGAPRAAGRPLPSPGSVPTGPALDVNHDGYDDLLVRHDTGNSTSGVVLGGPGGPTRTGVLLPAGVDVAFGRFGRGPGTDVAIGSRRGTALRYDVPGALRGALAVPGTALDAADLDADGRTDLVVSDGTRIRVFRGRATGLSPSDTVTLPPKTRSTGRVLAAADFDGDRCADLVVRTMQGATADTVAVYRGTRTGLIGRTPAVTFSTTEFLGMP